MVYLITNNKVTDLVPTKKAKRIIHEQNLHNSLRPFMRVAQILGILPHSNIFRTHKEMHFKWISWRTLYALLMIIYTSIAVVLCFLGWFSTGFRFSEFETLVFHTVSLTSRILYLRLATFWSKLMTSWSRMDKRMNSKYGYPEKLDSKFKIAIFVYSLLASGEYLMHFINRYLLLKNSNNLTFETYCESMYPRVSVIIPSDVFSFVYSTFLTFNSSVLWAFNDLFIILLSTGLALRFQQITVKLEKCYETAQPGNFWTEIREDYDRLTILCKELDERISYIVLLSYFINTFFLLFQLYNSLQLVGGAIGKVYLLYSLVYILVKIGYVSMYAAWINDESLEPAAILNSVSSALYNVEIKRLLLQIGFDNVVLTGCKLFRVKRGIILSIAGAVVTYELVLIQFNMATNVKI